MGTADIIVDPTNVAAFRAWDGAEGDHWAEHVQFYAESLRRYDRAFLGAARIAPTHRVLDVGCGFGISTLAAARRADRGFVVGVDLSARMLALARRRAADEGIQNVELVQADAAVYSFPATSFDRAISRMGVIYLGDPVAGLRNVARALRPHARLALLAWQASAASHWQAEILRALGLDPLSQEDRSSDRLSWSRPDDIRAMLSRAGFGGVQIEPLSELFSCGPDLITAFDNVRTMPFVRRRLDDLDQPARQQALAAVRESLERHAGPDGVLYPSATWLVGAEKP